MKTSESGLAILKQVIYVYLSPFKVLRTALMDLVTTSRSWNQECFPLTIKIDY